ncbi:DNA-protecting protein DprA, partial [Candidatus Falkowbacteria bacterium]|nr:DNA-protecting protein DprA [Candidatus Falkowbacteria bacterium]
LVINASDILEELNLKQIIGDESENQAVAETAEEETILKILSKEPIHIDKISQFSKLKINALSSALTLLEIRGAIKDLGGKNYIKNY